MAGSIMLLPSGDLEGLQLVGSGGFGLVYRGRSKMLSMEVALKMIQGSNSSNLTRLMRDLKKERDVMQKASNPHVLRLIGVYEKPEGNLIEHGLVMEYMPYGSLRSLFDNIPDVPWALRFQILHQVGLGMNYLHSLDPPIIHRDLKPSNVLLSRHLDAQITDFGLSKIVGATSSVAPSLAGTLSYMPPEALNDINYYSAKSFDVYSYGILTWTMFSCEEPYPGIPLAVIQRCVGEGQRPRASVLDQYSNIRMVPEVKELMIRCWNQNADNRPSFHDCSESTSLMLEAYTDEVVDAVRRVQDLLRKTSSQDQLTVTFEHSSISLEDFLKDLKNAQKDILEVETSSVDEKTEEKEDKNDNMLLLSEAVEDDGEISSAEAYMNNIATSITEFR
ncbi:receptor-interacting serine/threonine-protein kinase 3-like [Bufo gargarizans]|uniref:receptor-interacting serine/threonine-protein kinase 3-like n=1 Tax=Bufo gargarizans TaxID=30331 RepID=UPI001CF0DD39|nr:receptor-interacting serine/threonine-protein kinase 3-like [Bufo gargarizans]